MKCIIIDDDPLITIILKTYIEKIDDLEFVQEFENPIEASKYLNDNEVDFVILDVEMPEMSGIDAIIYLKTNATKRQFGEDELNTWALVDADGGSWEEPLIGWDGAATLLDQGMGVMAEDDQRKYSGIEYVYNVGIVGDRQIKLTYFHETASGVDPGASADPIIEFCTESRYNSVKLTQTINIGCWTDAATQAQVSSANRQKLTFDVTA